MLDGGRVNTGRMLGTLSDYITQKLPLSIQDVLRNFGFRLSQSLSGIVKAAVTTALPPVRP